MKKFDAKLFTEEQIEGIEEAIKSQSFATSNEEGLRKRQEDFGNVIKEIETKDLLIRDLKRKIFSLEGTCVPLAPKSIEDNFSEVLTETNTEEIEFQGKTYFLSKESIDKLMATYKPFEGK